MKTVDAFYLQQKEPIKGCLLALKQIILSQDAGITSTMKYGMPFFCYKQKMFCYLWYHKKHQLPYIGFVEGAYFNEPFLLQEKRLKMKIMLINPTQDLPLPQITKVLQKALNLYKTKQIKID